jgi:hypothetical protein
MSLKKKELEKPPSETKEDIFILISFIVIIIMAWDRAIIFIHSFEIEGILDNLLMGIVTLLFMFFFSIWLSISGQRLEYRKEIFYLRQKVKALEDQTQK